MSSISSQEQQWLKQLRADDELAFTELYNFYWEDLLRFAYKKTGSQEVAEDLVQELFINLWMKRSHLLISQSLRAYLFIALRHGLIDYIRANITRQNYLKNLTQAQIVALPEEATISEIESLVETTTQVMPERMRVVFELSRSKGYSSKQIADELGLSEQTVRNQISTALKRLRFQLKDYLLLGGLMFFHKTATSSSTSFRAVRLGYRRSSYIVLISEKFISAIEVNTQINKSEITYIYYRYFFLPYYLVFQSFTGLIR